MVTECRNYRGFRRVNARLRIEVVPPRHRPSKAWFRACGKPCGLP